MGTDTTVRARIDARVKKEAARVLDDMGLSVSGAIRMMLVRVAAEKALPFEVKVPNAVTARTLRKAGRGEIWCDPRMPPISSQTRDLMRG